MAGTQCEICAYIRIPAYSTLYALCLQQRTPAHTPILVRRVSPSLVQLGYVYIAINLREELSGWCWKRRGAAYAKEDTAAVREATTSPLRRTTTTIGEADGRCGGTMFSRRPPSTSTAQTVICASRLQDTHLACRLPPCSRQPFMGASVVIFKILSSRASHFASQCNFTSTESTCPTSPIATVCLAPRSNSLVQVTPSSSGGRLQPTTTRLRVCGVPGALSFHFQKSADDPKIPGVTYAD
ncbi:hypothetical protein D9619_012975 [Psilocybe cf. subviscida]|uniref:Uncharacterized protein n=1 Tax=Psilocybe cf. subviscida TaxID=2480587 RepID=A0A8H5BI56_9AGAR|nr:hypothetical protein D9619_012975 [Psilocybe cf. subviscida]